MRDLELLQHLRRDELIAAVDALGLDLRDRRSKDALAAALSEAKAPERLHLVPSRVKITSQRARWGSCSANSELRLNWRIIGAPRRLIEYVVAHELIHLLHADHTRLLEGAGHRDARLRSSTRCAARARAQAGMVSRTRRPVLRTPEDLLFKPPALLEERARWCIRGLYSMEDLGEPSTVRLEGTALYLRMRGDLYLLTAEHVIRQAQGRGVPVRYVDAEPMAVRGFVEREPHSLDLALIHLEQNARLGDSIVPAGTSVFAQTSGTVDGRRNLFVCGYPSRLARPSAFAPGGVQASTLGLLGCGRTESSYDWFDPKVHVLFEYDFSTPAIGETEDFDLPNADGLSGSPLWDSRLQELRMVWTPGDARIIGIVFAWDQPNHALVATRVEPVRKFLLGAVRRRAAYDHWEKRGRPNWDSLTDWSWANELVPDLSVT